MKENMWSSMFGFETTHQVWTLLEEQLIPITTEKEGHLKELLVTIQKGTRLVGDFLKDFKSIL